MSKVKVIKVRALKVCSIDSQRRRRGATFSYSLPEGEKLPGHLEVYDPENAELADLSGTHQEPPGAQISGDADELRAKLQSMGVEYHPRLGVKKLQILLDESIAAKKESEKDDDSGTGGDDEAERDELRAKLTQLEVTFDPNLRVTELHLLLEKAQSNKAETGLSSAANGEAQGS